MLDLPKGREIESVQSVLDNGSYNTPQDIIYTVKGLLETINFDDTQIESIIDLTAKRLELLFNEINLVLDSAVSIGTFEFNNDGGRTKIDLEANGQNVTQIQYSFPKKQA